MTVRSDRIDLLVTPGSTDRLVLHDIGADPGAVSEGPRRWRYHQRGHGRSGWVRGGGYGLDDLATDLLRVLAVVGTSVTVEAAGASAVVAALAAVARPGSVARIDAVPGRGWGSWPIDLLYAPAWAPNPRWLAGADSIGADRDDLRLDATLDPALALGPPELSPVAELAHDLAALDCPWSAVEAGAHDLLLPADRRVPAPPSEADAGPRDEHEENP